MVGRAGVHILLLALAGGVSAARSEVVEVRFGAPEPYAEGRSFGAIGPYVSLKGIAKGELDPTDDRNKVIVGLEKAPLNARGMVEYETDIHILRPADMSKGSGRLLYEAPNRGNKVLMLRLHNSRAGQAKVNDAKTAADVGEVPFAFERGYTLVWSGWDEVPAGNGRLSIRLPVATENGKEIVRRVRDEIQIGTRGAADMEVARLAYTAAHADTKAAKLVYRDGANGTRVEIPSDKWRFDSDRSIRLLPEGTKFKPLRIYEAWYDAKNPKVTGIGFAATRDVMSFLRYVEKDTNGNVNPLAGTVRYAMGFGVSLSGRYLRHHVELGMNADEKGRRVFDGVLAHTGGIGKVFANELFSHAGRTATQHEDRQYPENWFPFAFATSNDAMTGKTGSLFLGADNNPLVISTNTSTEYWQKGASLLTTDPAGTRDLDDHSKARTYFITGTQHVGNFNTPSSPGSCAMPRNPHDAYPAIRALLVALDEWISTGKAPPPSRVPRIADGTAVPFEQFRLPKIPGLVAPPGDNKISVAADWVDPPQTSEAIYGSRLPTVDADGNETSGIRLPDQAVPLGTFTGWNVYKGVETDLCDRDGAYLPFAKTKSEREANGDIRLSLEERYGSKDAYAARLKAAADELVANRLLLPGDAEAYVKTAIEAKGF